MKKQLQGRKLTLNRESLAQLDRMDGVQGGSVLPSNTRLTCHVLSICDACPGG
jgi:hypothetical protein